MKFIKKLAKLFRFLLPALVLLTGCSPEMENLAVDVLTEIVTEMETEIDDFVIDESVIDESVTDETLVTDDVVEESDESAVVESGTYTTKEEVAAYLYQFGHLPSNFITKKEAKALGWVSSEGNLWEVAPGMSIGGDYFGNYEGILPKAKGRDYYECDIDTAGSYRGAKRIVFSNDGLIYYTEDHYETFEILYGEE